MTQTVLKRGDRFIYKITSEFPQLLYEAVVVEITKGGMVKLKHINKQNQTYYDWYTNLEKFEVQEIVENVIKNKKLKEIDNL